jgi:serine/threonine-protein kinase
MSERPPLDPTVELPRSANPSHPRQKESETLPPSGIWAVGAPFGGQRELGRYVPGEEIACGGMGRVLRARDTDLGRDIAVKILREEHAGRPELVHRFVEEARITGCLQHPGIPPVHEFGVLPDGRPWFTMKLIQGRTLADLLAERKQTGKGDSTFIGIFEQVCQTMAYAHSRGVIHRDLKPSNIMVGAFAEVQVMDWGLAKVLAASKAEEIKEVEGQEPRPDAWIPQVGEGHTLAGSVLGTPSWMAPEQARGEIERIDERSDVFGLGAILCAILTGKPPYDGPTNHEIHVRAYRVDLTDALLRLDQCRAEPELAALARSCLAANPADRPANAGEVADTVAAYRAGVEQRLRSAEMDRAAAEVRAAGECKARRLTAGLAIAVLGLAALGMYALWSRQAEEMVRRGHRDGVTRLVEGDLAEVERLRLRARSGGAPGLWVQALAAARRAEGRLSGEPELADLRQRVLGTVIDLEQERVDRDMAALLEQLRLRKIELKDDLLDTAPAPDYAAAFRDYGIDVTTLSIEEAARRIAGSRIHAVLAAALDDWTEAPGKGVDVARLRLIALKGDPSPWRGKLRQAMARRDGRELQQLARDAEAPDQLPASLYLLGRALARSGFPDDAIGVLRRGQRKHPLDFWLNFELARQLDLAGPRFAVEEARLATVARSLRPDAPVVHLLLGRALFANRDYKQAIVSYKEAIRLKKDFALPHYSIGLAEVKRRRSAEAAMWFRKAIALAPGYVEAHNNLGAALSDAGDQRGAMEAFRQAIRIKPGHARAHVNLGHLLAKQNRPEEAITHLRIAIRCDPTLAVPHSNLGNLFRQLGRIDPAIAELRQAIRLDPNLALAHDSLGVTLLAKGDVPGAIASLRRAVRLAPTDAQSQADLGVALLKAGQIDLAIATLEESLHRNDRHFEVHNALGDAWKQKGAWDRAARCYRKAVRLAPKEVVPRVNLGIALTEQAQIPQALAAFRGALELAPKYGPAHTHLAIALYRGGLRTAALESFQAGVRLDPQSAVAHGSLAQAWLLLSHPGKAAASYREAVRLQKDYPEGWKGLGDSLVRMGRRKEAAAAYREVVRLRPRDGNALFGLGVCCEISGDESGAIDAYRRLTTLAPTQAGAWCRFGRLLQRQGGFAAAVVALRRGHAWGAGKEGWPFPSGQWLAEAERLLALEPKLAAIVVGKIKPMGAAEAIDFALLCRCKGQDAAAARFFREAFAARPGLAEEGTPHHRFLGACSTARAGCGLGGGSNLDEKERAVWRRQALEWLREELVWQDKKMQSERVEAQEKARRALEQWQNEPALEGVRGKDALAKLPEEESKAWGRFWQEVRELLEKGGRGKG